MKILDDARSGIRESRLNLLIFNISECDNDNNDANC